MTLITRLWLAIRQDRYLQIGLLALAVGSASLIQGIEGDERQSSSLESFDGPPVPNEFKLEDREPFVFELPATQETVRESALALLSGRVLLMKDENGNWRRIEPLRSSDRSVQDHSETLMSLAKHVCSGSKSSSPDAFVSSLTEEQVQEMCVLAAYD